MIVMSLSKPGHAVGERIARALGAVHMSKWGGTLRRAEEAVDLAFARGEALVAVMALGGLVRLIAPRLRDKFRDPPVLDVDDGGRFVVVVLGAHRGGNELALRVAEAIGAIPVLTDGATSLGVPSVEEVAAAVGAVPTPEAVLRGNAALVNGLRVALVFYTPEPPNSPQPLEALWARNEEELREIAERYDEILVVSKERPPVGLWLRL